MRHRCCAPSARYRMRLASRHCASRSLATRSGPKLGLLLHQDNQPSSRTDQLGLAVLPRLRAYDRKPVRIELDDLPADAKIDAPKLVAVPCARSGLLLDFPV